MTPRDAKKAVTREKIATVARGLFERRGFGAVGIRDIAEAADLSTGAIFVSWATKEALFADVMGRPWPDAAAFARWVVRCPTFEAVRAGAIVFLGDVAGEDREGPEWRPDAQGKDPLRG